MKWTIPEKKPMKMDKVILNSRLVNQYYKTDKVWSFKKIYYKFFIASEVDLNL